MPIVFSKFYGKVGILVYVTFYLLRFWLEKLNCGFFPTHFLLWKKTPQNNFLLSIIFFTIRFYTLQRHLLQKCVNYWSEGQTLLDKPVQWAKPYPRDLKLLTVFNKGKSPLTSNDGTNWGSGPQHMSTNQAKVPHLPSLIFFPCLNISFKFLYMCSPKSIILLSKKKVGNLILRNGLFPL